MDVLAGTRQRDDDFETWLAAAFHSDSNTSGTERTARQQAPGRNPWEGMTYAGSSEVEEDMPADRVAPSSRSRQPCKAGATRGRRSGTAPGGKARASATRETPQQRAHRLFYERKKERVSYRACHQAASTHGNGAAPRSVGVTPQPFTRFRG